MGGLHNIPVYPYNKYADIERKTGVNFTGPFIHPSISDFEKDVEEKYKNRSLIENNISKMKLFHDRDCLGIRKLNSKNEYEKHYTYFKYGEIYKMSSNFAKNLHQRRGDLIVEDIYDEKNFSLIGIFAKNCPEWVITDNACQMDTITTVTLYSTLGEEAFKHICVESLISTICVSPDLVDMLCKWKTKYDIETLKNCIWFDYTTNCNGSEMKKLQDAGFNAISFKEMILENTTVKEEELALSKPDTVLTICYTSGTTGLPKGVMIIQRNMISMLETVIADSGVPLDSNGCHMSFLPLAHIMERIVMCGFMSVAAKIGFLSGTVRTSLWEDIGILKPTLLFTVPRVLQTFHQKIFENFDKWTCFQKELAYYAMNVKRTNFRNYGVITHTVYDRLIFKKIRTVFGGDWRVILCASAPLPKDIADDFKLLLSIPIVEGWGMTELTGPATATHTTDWLNNTAGGVISSSLMKLVDVPELGYTKNSVFDGRVCPSGEICIKGPSTCVGYYKKPQETSSTFDQDGYLHTGDVGRIYPHFGNGIRIIDRVKEIFKLSQGEYIIPNKLEAVYEKSKYVTQILIYGNSMKNNIIAIITPNKKECAQFLKLSENDRVENYAESPILIKEIVTDLGRLAETANFNSWEKVNYIILTMEDFTIENGCMTPTMKMIRKKIELKYKNQIEELYSAISSGKANLMSLDKNASNMK